MEPWILLLVFAIVAATILVVMFSYTVARRLIRPPRKRGNWTPRDLGLEYIDVEVEASDGVRLRGWFIDRGADKTIVAIHGYTSSRWDEGYMKPLIGMLARHGFNVAAFDFRGHGESTGEYTTLGFKEVEDYQAIISWLKSSLPHRSERIGVIGYSMGGAVAIMLAASDERIDAAIADSPYMDILESGKRWIRRINSPIKHLLLALYPLIAWLAARTAGVDTSRLQLYHYADKLKAPLLLIAGGRDDLVSINEIKRFHKRAVESGKHVELWITDSRHVSAINDYPEEYERIVIAFFERWMRA